MIGIDREFLRQVGIAEDGEIEQLQPYPPQSVHASVFVLESKPAWDPLMVAVVVSSLMIGCSVLVFLWFLARATIGFLLRHPLP